MRRKIRVLYLVDSLAGGGTQQAIFDYAKFCDRSVIDLKIIPLSSCDDVFSKRIREYAPVDFVSTDRNSVLTLLNPGTWSCLERMIREFAPDILHARLDGSLVFGSVLAGRLKVPKFVFTIEASEKQVPYFCARRPAYRALLKRACVIFTNYPDEYREMGLPSEKMALYQAAVDLDEAADRPDCIASEEIFKQNSPVLASVGRLHPDKGHQYAVQLMSMIRSSMPKAHLYICGEGAYRKELERLIKRENLTERVTLTGYLRSIDWVLKHSDIFLSLMTNEPLNLSAARAMKWGLPVLAFKTGLHAHIRIREGMNGFELPLRDLRTAPDRLNDLLKLTDKRSVQSTMFLPSNRELAQQYDELYMSLIPALKEG